MTQLLILVEGQTEESFVNSLLGPHLAERNVFVTPTLVVTRHLPGLPADKGGIHSFEPVKRDLKRLLGHSAAWTTTLFDFYGLPDDFPRPNAPSETPEECVVQREQALASALGSPARFIPFFALHEFEAWVLADAEAIASHFGRPALANDVSSLLAQHGSNPEHINHGVSTHPSARLKALVPTYKKTGDGPRILERIGLDALRQRCAHFGAWLSKLEQLGG